MAAKLFKESTVRGLSELRTYLSGVNLDEKNVFILFTGDKNESKESWCQDCNVAEPIINESLSSLDETCDFVTCYVGDRTK
jgi:hypothetical protein